MFLQETGQPGPEPDWLRELQGVTPVEAPHELFNLADDPGQTTNVNPRLRDRAERMAATLQRLVDAGRTRP